MQSWKQGGIATSEGGSCLCVVRKHKKGVKSLGVPPPCRQGVDKKYTPYGKAACGQATRVGAMKRMQIDKSGKGRKATK